MELRIYRTWRWVTAVESTIGQKLPLQLESIDEIQYRAYPLVEWKPVPIVEAEKPEHPADIESRKQNEEIKMVVDRMIAGGAILNDRITSK